MVTINQTKLTAVKVALQRTIELSEKATPGPWEARCDVGLWSVDGQVEGIADFVLQENASYIAHACNLGAPTAKALLGVIEDLETDIRLGGELTKGIAEIRLSSILATFPDEM